MAGNKGGSLAAAQQRAVQREAADKPMTLKDYVEVQKPGIERALPAWFTPDRFVRMVLSGLSANPKLNECTPKSFLGAVMNAAQLGLEPNTPLGQAYIIPYRNHGVMEAQFQIGYKGLIKLASRSGVTEISAHEVYENDDFDFWFGLEPDLKHKPALRNRGEVIAYYATFKTKDGGKGFEVMSREDVEKHAQKYSKSYSNGPWKTNFDEMAKKTVLKKLLKYAPLDSDFAMAIAQDGTIKHAAEADNDIFLASDMTDYGYDYDVDADTGEVLDSDMNAP